MKKMEFMRSAAKEFMDFFAELYKEGKYYNQTISLKRQQGSFTLKWSGGILKFYVYTTGSISYNCGSFVGTRQEYSNYYIYSAEDNHKEVLKKLRSDLRKLKKYFERVFSLAMFESNAFNWLTFCYEKPFSSDLRIDKGDEEQ